MQLIGLILVLVSLVLLFIQNRLPTLGLQFLGTQTITLPLAAWVVGFTLLGILTGWLISGLIQAVLVVQTGRLQAQIRRLQTEVDQLEEFEDIPESVPDPRAARPSAWGKDADAATEEEPDDLQFDDGADPVDFGDRPSSPNLQDSSRYSTRNRDNSPLNLRSPFNHDRHDRPSAGSYGTVDAEYRVLVPPPSNAGIADEYPQTRAEEDEDWDFEDDRWDDWDRDRPARDRW